MIRIRRDPGPCIVCDAPHTSCTPGPVIAIVQLPQRDGHTEPPLVGEVEAAPPLERLLEPDAVTTATYQKEAALMGVRIDGPYGTGYGSRYIGPHAVSVLVEPPLEEPLTLEEAKLRAGLDWVDGDPRDALLEGFIKAAREYVEHRTGLALLTQTRDLSFDRLPPSGYPLQLPVTPIQEVTSFAYIDTSGGSIVIDPLTYVVDPGSGRLGLASGAWPTNLRTFQPVTIRAIVGWESVEALTAARPLLIHAVGLLAAHNATVGRDLATAGSMTTTPHGFEEALAPYVQEFIA